MKTIEAIVTISPNGNIQLSQAENLPIGKFKVVLVIDESMASQDSDSPQSLPIVNTEPRFCASSWDNFIQEIDKKSSLNQGKKLKDLLISWREESDQDEQSETLKVMSQTE